MVLQDLPPEILKQIFDLLNFHERIKIERVCKDWKDLCWNWAWLDCKDLRFSREDLLLCEDWKNKEEINDKIKKLDEAQTNITQQLIKEYKTIHRNCDGDNYCEYCPKKTNVGKSAARYERYGIAAQKYSMNEYKQLFSNPSLYKKKRPSRSLGVFSALIRRCSPCLEFLSIDQGIGISTRVGRYFHFLKPCLTHFSMMEPIDVWHLNQIEEHLSPNLLSLHLFLNKRKRTLDAFLSLVLKCQKLECLRINRFNEIFERSLAIGQRHFLPSTLLQLFICGYSNNALLALPKICPKLCFLLVYKNYCNPDDEKLYDTKILSLCWPFLFTVDPIDLNFHSNLYSIRALKVHDFPLYESDLLKLASSCPNLEHLDFYWKNYVDDYDGPVDARQLEALYKFKKLFSLSIRILIISRRCVNSFMPFHDNLECRDQSDFNFSKEYTMKILTNLNDLETFSCRLDSYNETNKSNEFFHKLFNLLKENGKKSRASFRFTVSSDFNFSKEYTMKILTNLNYHYYRRKSEEYVNYDIIFKWKNGNQIELIKVPKLNLFRDVNFGQSIVLEEILNESFGERNKQILFGTFEYEERKTLKLKK
uniref:F-box domain-containing protein n=1 Tax=Meloidogyne hapla TaxID=6305 RepID=A0A1I8BBV1_MELHA